MLSLARRMGQTENGIGPDYQVPSRVSSAKLWGVRSLFISPFSLFILPFRSDAVGCGIECVPILQPLISNPYVTFCDNKWWTAVGVWETGNTAEVVT